MSWIGVKKQTNIGYIKSWCEGMGIKNYTINSKGEIDVDGHVDLIGRDFKELPYKFGKVKGSFALIDCANLTSLKNCPKYVGGWFSCSSCRQLNSLKGCPKEVGWDFRSGGCKREFTEREIMSLCKVGGDIYRK